MKSTGAERTGAASLSELLREVLRPPSGKPKTIETPVTRAVRDVLRVAPAANRARQGRTARKGAITASPTMSRLKLARSLAEVRTNIIAADKMTPKQKLRTAQLANELAARLRKAP